MILHVVQTASRLNYPLSWPAVQSCNRLHALCIPSRSPGKPVLQVRGHFLQTDVSKIGRTTSCGAPTLSAFCMSSALLVGEACSRSTRCFRLSSIETEGGLNICCLPATEASAPRSSRDTWEVSQED